MVYNFRSRRLLRAVEQSDEDIGEGLRPVVEDTQCNTRQIAELSNSDMSS